MHERTRTFIPAMGRDWLLPLYDPFTRLAGLDRTRRAVVTRAELRPGERVLDVGCGTGTLATLLARSHPEVAIVGLDPDPKALAKAGRKARRAALAIQFDRGFADALPYPDASFDRVFSTFMLHHLEPAEKLRMLGEIRRVLKPGGRLHLLDFVGRDAPSHPHPRHSHGGRLADNTPCRVLAFMTDAGLSRAVTVETTSVLAGHMHVACFEACAAS